MSFVSPWRTPRFHVMIQIQRLDTYPTARCLWYLYTETHGLRPATIQNFGVRLFCVCVCVCFCGKVFLPMPSKGVIIWNCRSAVHDLTLTVTFVYYYYYCALWGTPRIKCLTFRYSLKSFAFQLRINPKLFLFFLRCVNFFGCSGTHYSSYL